MVDDLENAIAYIAVIRGTEQEGLLNSGMYNFLTQLAEGVWIKIPPLRLLMSFPNLK